VALCPIGVQAEMLFGVGLKGAAGSTPKLREELLVYEIQ
jgi:hypothetical protein